VNGPRFGHVVLRTNRLAAMQAWYCAVLDARVVSSAPGVVFLSYDQEHHRVALVDLGPLAAARDDVPGLAHVAFAHARLTDLLEAHERLARAGIAPARAVHHELTASLYYLDPDRNELELYADCTGSRPRPSWDPAPLLRLLRAGAGEAELLAHLHAGG
jgi:catechol-2,3-dioxygenase